MDVNSIDPNSFSLLVDLIKYISSSPWWRDPLLVLIGGLCAAAGSVLATIGSVWYQAKKTREMKREETIGSQEVDACKKALRLADNLRSILFSGTYDDVLGWMKKENPWVLDNEIFLPIKFVINWHSIRSNTLRARRRDQRQSMMSDGPERNELIEEIGQRDEFNIKLSEESEEEIRKHLGLSLFEIRPFKLRYPNESTVSEKDENC
jgi:hypothetical protein